MEEIEDTVIKDPTAGVFKEQKLRPARPSIPTQKEEPIQSEEDLDFFDYAEDIALAPFRGIEGMLNGAYNLADMIAFDVLPDLDTRFLGTSKTTAGSLVEGVAQFASGFVPIFGAAGKIGALAKAGTVARGVAAGAVTDFVAFKGQEDRLSNLIQQFPELQNPVTEFLAHDANESEVEGRLKNVLEGLILEGAIGGTVTLFMKSIRALKAGKKVRDVDGGGADEVNKATSDSLEGGKAFAEMPQFGKKFIQEPLTTEDVLRNKSLFMWDEGYSVAEISRTLKTSDKEIQDYLIDIGETPKDFIRGRKDSSFQPEVSQENIEAVGMNTAIRMWDEGYSTSEIAKTVNLPKKFIEDEFISLGEDPKDFIKGRKDTGFGRGDLEVAAEKEERIVFSSAIEMWTEGYSVREISKSLNFPEERLVDELVSMGEDPRDFLGRKDRPFSELPAFKDEARVVQKELDLDKNRLDELLKKKEEGKATGADETRISMLENRIEGKEADLRVLGDVRTADVKDRVRVAEERELQERVEELDETLEDFDATVERVPRPFKTYEEEGMMDIIPKGADTLKNRLMKKFPIKGADPQDVADVEKFIDVMGKRLFGDVSLSVTNKIPSAGRYNFGNNLLQIRQSVIDEGGIKRTMVHELWHGLSRYLPKTDVTSLTKQFDKARRDYIRSFGVDLDDTVDPSSLLKKTIPKELEKFLKGKHTSENYRFKDVDEYFAEEMTDAFLKKLDEKDLAPSGTLKRIAQEVAIMFKDMFASLKSKLGVDQRQKIFNDFLKQRNVTKRAEAPLDFGKTFAEMPDFKPKIKTDPEWQQWTNAVLKGESPTLPRLEVVGDIDSAHKILTEKYSNNPELLKKFDEAPADFLDEDLTSLFEMGAQSIKDRRKIRVESEIFKDLLKGSNERLMKVVKEFEDTESLQSEAALRNQLSEFVEIYDYYRQMGSEDSKNLAMRRQKKPISRKIGLEKSELQNTALVREFINNQAGGMSPKKAVKLIKEMYDPNNPEATIKKVLGIAKKAQGKSLLDMTTEYWINSILSGPRTQAVNLLGNLLTQALGAAEMTAGAVLSGNMPLAKAALALSFDWNLYREALSAAGKTLITGREVLDVGSRTMETSRQAIGESIDFDPLGKGSKNIDRNAINTLGTVINLPARGLLTGDEFFKQIAFRRAARLKAGMEAINSGISDSKGIAKYVEDKLSKVVTVGGQVMSEEALIREAVKQADELGLVGQKFAKKRAAHIKKYVDDNFDEDASNLAAYALEEAKYFTHTRELEEGTLGKGIQNLTKNFAFARFVLPFVRTPSNLLSFALERSPLGLPYRIPGTNKKLNVPGLRAEAEAMREGLKSSDPVVKAAARGKIVTAFTAAGLFYDMVFNNNNTFPTVTGGGPKDEKQKKILAETGWRPYSIKIGDTYYSYQRLDPIATLLGISADMSEMMKENQEANEEGLEQVGIAMATALARNVGNKSYLAGVQLWADAFKDPERFGEKLGRNYVSSFVPNVLSQMQDYDKQSMREVRSIADAVLKKMPGGRDMLDPRRNILGEEKTIDYGTMGFINPVATSKEKDDEVLQEMADLQYAFRQPSPKLSGGNVNLLDFVNNRGRTAYDRSLDLLQTVTVGGRTLRQTLKRLIKSSQYQRLPGFSAEVGVDSPRVQEITKVLRRYRKTAKREMLKEFPDVATQINNVDRALKLNRQGVNRQEVLELLQQTN